MPYINIDNRARAGEAPDVPGELNYAITMKIVARLFGLLTFQEFDAEVRMLVMEYLDRVGMSYTNGNAVMGVLDCAARELRRRLGPVMFNPIFKGADIAKIERQLKLERKWLYENLIVPYEDVKIAENGDVFPEDLLSGS